MIIIVKAAKAARVPNNELTDDFGWNIDIGIWILNYKMTIGMFAPFLFIGTSGKLHKGAFR